MNNRKKKVLVITYSFPPNPRVAALRMRGLARYLPSFGWDPTFLTVNLPGKPEEGFRVIQTADPDDVIERFKRTLQLNPKVGLQEQLGISDRISFVDESITGRFIKRIEGWITYPDTKKPWQPVALKKLRNLLSEECFHALISSSPPPITHLIAKEIKNEYALYWIADMRDLWSQNYNYPYGRIRRLLDQLLERSTISKADSIVTVSSPLGDRLASIHPDKKIHIITNGFDPEDCRNGEPSRKFSITYTGQIYPGKQQPEILLKVLSDLVQEGYLSEDNVEVKFYGPRYLSLEKNIADHNLGKVINQMGVVPREVALVHQRNSQILLMLNWVDGSQRGVYTGKIFEYLAAGRPILAVGGPQGVVSKLLLETKAGVHPTDELDLRKTILAWYKEFQQQGSVSYNGNDRIQEYSHIKMAERFAGVLNEVSQ